MILTLAKKLKAIGVILLFFILLFAFSFAMAVIMIGVFSLPELIQGWRLL
jgi:hypothetical protein